MKEHLQPSLSIWLLATAFAATALNACAQSPRVPIYEAGQAAAQMDAVIARKVESLRQSGKALKLDAVRDQLRRSSCQLELPKPKTAKLSSREIRELARQSHIGVGWSYLCTKCDDWHLKLAGGYALTQAGAVATCHHVVRPRPDMREGYLVAADEAGNVFPVTEILAANRYSDACIVRIKGTGFAPLALSTNVSPGDAVYCFSNPQGRPGYFSQGIVNRIFKLPEQRLPYVPGAPFYAPTRINVSADWSVGSSGSPVLDEYGNAIGHVSTISVEGEDQSARTEVTQKTTSVTTVTHEAVSARDVMMLIMQGR